MGNTMIKWPNMQSDGQIVKVCYIITKGVWGGAGKYVWSLATNLPKEKYEVVVITGEGEALKERLEKSGIKTYTLRNLKRDISIINEIESFFKLLRIIRKERPKILHLNSPKASGLGSVPGRLLFVPQIIQTVHGFSWNEDRPEWQKILITLFSWLTIILCHKTIVLSSQEQRQAKKLPLVRDSKIILIRNGIEKIAFKEKDTARQELLTLFGHPMSKFKELLWIGTISELHKNKGLEYAISAIAYIKKSFIFCIIGEGDERENLEKLIKKNTLQEKVFLLGFVDKANEYLKTFDIFTLTSLKEGLPYSILEAGLAELPVIASNVGGIPNIIENGLSGILTTKTRVGEITRAIEYLMDNPDKRELYGKNLKQKVEKDFSFEQMLERTTVLYI